MYRARTAARMASQRLTAFAGKVSGHHVFRTPGQIPPTLQRPALGTTFASSNPLNPAASPVSLGYFRFARIRATFPRVSETLRSLWGHIFWIFGRNPAYRLRRSLVANFQYPSCDLRDSVWSRTRPVWYPVDVPNRMSCAEVKPCYSKAR